MPLVVPGINSSSGNDEQTWLSKLAGKRITDSGSTDETNFSKKELPENHRVLGKGDMATMDFQQDRLNIHLGDNGTVEKVTKG